MKQGTILVCHMNAHESGKVKVSLEVDEKLPCLKIERLHSPGTFKKIPLTDIEKIVEGTQTSTLVVFQYFICKGKEYTELLYFVSCITILDPPESGSGPLFLYFNE